MSHQPTSGNLLIALSRADEMILLLHGQRLSYIYPAWIYSNRFILMHLFMVTTENVIILNDFSPLNGKWEFDQTLAYILPRFIQIVLLQCLSTG